MAPAEGTPWESYRPQSGRRVRVRYRGYRVEYRPTIARRVDGRWVRDTKVHAERCGQTHVKQATAQECGAKIARQLNRESEAVTS